MAVVEHVGRSTSTQNSNNSEVILLSSDDEDNEENMDDVIYLFDRFILACRPHIMEKEALILARKKFKEAPRDFVCSKETIRMLKRYTTLVKKENAYVYMANVCKMLMSDKSPKQPTVTNHNDNLNGRRTSCGDFDVTEARDFKVNENRETFSKHTTDDSQEIHRNTVDVSDDDVCFVCEVERKKPTDLPSTSSSYESEEAKFPRSGKITTKDLSVRQKKKLVLKLERRLKEISQEIKILNKSELTLDEMEMADSSYIKENRLKKKFDKTWNKLCKILGRPPNTGRVVEKKIRASCTGYPIIDRAIERFLEEKRGRFPDYFDIRNVVLTANERHDLRMSPQVLNGVIVDVFTDIGNKLQRLREKDLVFNFGSHLLDDFKSEEDPALSSQELCKQLERNRKISKRNLKQVYTKFTHLERYGKAGKKGISSTSTDKVSVLPEENGEVNSEVTTTDEEQEMPRPVKYASISDEDSTDGFQQCSLNKNFMNDCRPTRSNHATESLDDDTPRTEKYVSSESNEDSMDATPPGSSRTLLTTEDCATTSNINIETSVVHSPPVFNDDCQIIVNQPEEKACKSNSNQSHNTSECAEVGVPTPPNEQKSDIGNLNLCKTYTTSGNTKSESPDASSENKLGENNLKKRKASSELQLEELNTGSSPLQKVILALKNKRLKAPCSQTKENSTETVVSLPPGNKEITSKKPLAVKMVFNESNYPVPKNGKPQISVEQRQMFRERTLNALKPSLKNIHDKSVNNGLNSQGVCSTAKSTRKAVSTISATNHCIPSEEQEHEIIVIDDD